MKRLCVFAHWDRDNIIDDYVIYYLKALKEASGFLRTELAKRVDIRHIPELQFVYDESIDYGKHIEDLIDQIHKKGE